MVFVYRPLSSQRSEIRLVRFVDPEDIAGLAALPIRLEIRHASLNDRNVQYGALSYAWGDPSQRNAAEVHVNGEPFVIGGNLHAGLAQLRRNGFRSWIWVDSICIQQSDYAEKTWQVAQMGAIFSQVELVYIWLGPHCHETDLAMGFISRIGPRALALGLLDLPARCKTRHHVQDDISKLLSKASQQRYLEHSPTAIRQPELARFAIELFEEPGMTGGPSRNTNLMNGINKIFQREYWYRIWVIQEVALARDAVVLCDAKNVPIDNFHAASNMIRFTRKGAFHRFRPQHTLMTRQKYLDGKEPVTLADIIVPAGRPPLRPFYSASDSQDIVFGVLGIITENESISLRADYRKTPAQIFTALTRALIHHGEQRFVPKQMTPPCHLGHCVPRGEGNMCDIDLPSWVPDWREVGIRGLSDTRASRSGCTVSTHMTWRHRRQTLRAPTRMSNSDASENTGAALMLSQRSCSHQVGSLMASGHCLSLQTRQYIARVIEFANLRAESSPGEDHVWRTITMGDGSWLKDDSSSLTADIACLVRKMTRREPIRASLLTSEQKACIHDYAFLNNLDAYYEQKNSEELLEYVAQHWQDNIKGGANRGRTLFKTAKSMLGLGHTAIQPGDTVTLMWGIGPPIILRARDERSGGGFRFVGDAYVDGIMRGEFLETSPTHETFHIY
ncbi:Heterokaryon incompatibility protein 6, OR allele [Tolypocladium ophioglossoides CBS 100239]|uniref:Heterokaryon incompatibility protein 6, OR allele n=1 Tax=Tolypocladium ophioglossoides (strain CBS 100239) TaxID=1163406 RepID=A0A0L0NI38_TOLOC|nr:Heterokaryon incompatibility protein 6, OR allele [Tolypocladium ophioglossoides CBS 100239]